MTVHVSEGELTANQVAVLAAVRGEGFAPVKYLKRTAGLDARTVARALAALEARGLVVRYFNAHGPQTPWWYQPAPPAVPAGQLPDIAAKSVWDWGRTEDRTWLEVVSGPDIHGVVICDVRAGEHNTVRCPLPAALFAGSLWERRPGTFTDWSRQFSCPVHGECSEEMVRTDKCCALCSSPLNRH